MSKDIKLLLRYNFVFKTDAIILEVHKYCKWLDTKIYNGSTDKFNRWFSVLLKISIDNNTNYLRRYIINLDINQEQIDNNYMSKLYIPKSLKYFLKHLELCDGIEKDNINYREYINLEKAIFK